MFTGFMPSSRDKGWWCPSILTSIPPTALWAGGEQAVGLPRGTLQGARCGGIGRGVREGAPFAWHRP